MVRVLESAGEFGSRAETYAGGARSLGAEAVENLEDAGGEGDDACGGGVRLWEKRLGWKVCSWEFMGGLNLSGKLDEDGTGSV